MIKRAIMYLKLANNELVDLEAEEVLRQYDGGQLSVDGRRNDLNRQRKITHPGIYKFVSWFLNYLQMFVFQIYLKFDCTR